MTKNQMIKKALVNRKLINTMLKHAILHLANSGALNAESDYSVKVLTYAALKDVAAEWRPLSEEGRQEAINLGKF